MSRFHPPLPAMLFLLALSSAVPLRSSEILVYSVTRTGTSVTNEAKATVAPITTLTGVAPVTGVVSEKSYLILDRGIFQGSDGIWRGNMARVFYFTRPFGTGQQRAYEVRTGVYRMSSTTDVVVDQEKPYKVVLNEGPGSTSNDPLAYEQMSVAWAYDGLGSTTSPFPLSAAKAGTGISSVVKLESSTSTRSERQYYVETLHGMSSAAYQFPVPAGSVPLRMYFVSPTLTGHWQTSRFLDWDRSAESPVPPALRTVTFQNLNGTQKATLNTKLTVESNPVTMVRGNGTDNLPNTSDDIFTLVRDGDIQLGLLSVVYTLRALGYMDVTPDI